MKKIILTTTNTVEFGKITEYKGLIQTSLILGNNAVSEFISGFTDLFGGFSNTLRSKFDELYENASKEIEDKARKKGADAVVGMKVDFEELAGKGKSMFMISIVGTAVKMKFDSEADEDKYSNEELYVNNTALNFELTKDKILRKLNDLEKRNMSTVEEWNPYLTDEEWNFILSYSLPQYAERLSDLYNAPKPSDTTQENYPRYIATLEIEDAKDIVYGNIQNALNVDNVDAEKIKKYKSIIKQLNLFDAKRLIGILNSDGIDINSLTPLLTLDKDIYRESDLKDMEELLSIFDNLKDKGRKEEVKGGLFSKASKIKFICPNGHANNEEVEYCETCYLNIKGLTITTVKEIENYRKKVLTLRTLMSNLK